MGPREQSCCETRSGALQDFLERKALELSFSPVAHLRWFLNGIFKLAVSGGLVLNNLAAELRIPRKSQPGRDLHPPGGRGGESVPGGARQRPATGTGSRPDVSPARGHRRQRPIDKENPQVCLRA